jgi:sulfate/thiosulfate transport system substrate-binding protein
VRKNPADRVPRRLAKPVPRASDDRRRDPAVHHQESPDPGSGWKDNMNRTRTPIPVIALFVARLLAAGALVLSTCGTAGAQTKLLNVSYDPTRELYKEVNEVFAKEWQAKTGQALTIDQSHGGSGAQARAVIDGLDADVVTLALAYDIDAISDKAGLLPPDWQDRLPHRSSPYTSTIVFLVRKGNPKKILDWGDLVRPGVEVITPNPKTSGAARWAYLAAWGYVRKKGGDEAAAQDFVRRLYKNVPVMDTGARGSTNTFVQRGMGDVLLAWENEAILAVRELGPDKLEIVAPSISILAEPPVAWLDRNVTKHGTQALAKAYLEFLYSETGQEIAAKHYYRPRLESVAKAHAGVFPKVKLFTIEEMFGTWRQAQAKHFADGGVFDAIFQPGK